MHNAYSEVSNKFWANYRQEIDAPYNSMESDEDLDLFATDTSEEENKPVVKVEKKEGEKKKLDLTKIQASAWNMKTFKPYPHRAREGEVPLKLLHGYKIEVVEQT